MKHILLFTGGVDSTVAYYFLRQKMKIHSVELLYYTLNHKYEQSELEAIKHLTSVMLKDSDTFTIMNNLQIGEYEEPDATIPGRNLLLISLAAIHVPGPCCIYLPVQEGEETIPDRSPEFFEHINYLLSFLLAKDVIVSPVFYRMTKQDVVKWFVSSAHEEDAIKRHLLSCSFSCYSQSQEHKQCGNCPACVRKYISFRYAEFEDDWEVNWSTYPWLSPLYKKYYQDADARKYTGRRAQQILEVYTHDVITRRLSDSISSI